MLKTFTCGTFHNEEDDEACHKSSDFSPSPRSRRSKTHGKSSKNNNPYSSRGRDKFSALLADLDERRQKIYSQTTNRVSQQLLSHSHRSSRQTVCILDSPSLPSLSVDSHSADQSSILPDSADPISLYYLLCDLPLLRFSQLEVRSNNRCCPVLCQESQQKCPNGTWLRILPYHDFNKAPHGCGLCPPNMCKGLIIERIQDSMCPQESKRLIYLGDGAGDYCPSLRLKERDCVMPRKDFPVWDLICKDPLLVKAEIHEWSDGGDLERVLKNLINKISKEEEASQFFSPDCKLQTLSVSSAHEALPKPLRVQQ